MKLILFRLLIIILNVYFLSFSGCNKSSKEDDSNIPESLIFNVNEELVGERIVDQIIDITYRVPKHWEKMSNSQIEEEIQKLIYLKEDDKKITVSTILMNKLTDSYIVLSKIDTIGTDYDELIYSLNKNILSLINDTMNVKKAEYLFLPFHIYQFQYVLSEYIFLKLILKIYKQDSNLIQIDFVTKTENYNEITKVFESFIGSIKNNPKP